MQLPPVEHQNAEQANLYAPYYNSPSVYIPPYYGPSYWGNGIYQHTGLQPSSNWVEPIPPHYPSQPIENMVTQPEYSNYDRENVHYDYVVPTSDTYPAPTDNNLDEYTSSSPVQELEPFFKPNEETKAFWRPNFLR